MNIFVFFVIPLLTISVKSQQIVRTPVPDSELRALVENLWTLDVNNVASQVRINTQDSVSRMPAGTDNAPNPLLSVPSTVYQKPTFAKLIALQDNYIPESNVAENVTPQEKTEESAFLDAVLATTVMKKAEEFLLDKRYIISRKTGRNGQVQVNKNAFKEALQQIWCDIYSRGNRTLSSSGFEHVFAGELKNGQVSGLHNWVFFARQETANNLNYNGHIRIVRLGSRGIVIKDNFKWKNTLKPVGTMFVGTSPEFEMAVYTVCFYARPGGICPVTISGKSVPIITHFFTQRGKQLISSAYPDI